MLWVESLFIPFFLMFIRGDITDKIATEPLKTIFGMVVLSVIGGLFFVHFPLRALITQANTAQKEVKKMMLEDIKQQVQELQNNKVYE
jgi:hypothetical protein